MEAVKVVDKSTGQCPLNPRIAKLSICYGHESMLTSLSVPPPLNPASNSGSLGCRFAEVLPVASGAQQMLDSR
jgi:hypothetical protein